MATTDRDIKDTVLWALADEASQFDVDGIVEELKSAHGLTTDISVEDFWAAVEHNAK